MIYLISTVIVAAILTVLSLFPLRGKNEIFPGFEKALKRMTTGKVRKGQAVEGYVEFGLSETNPIPTCTTFGSYNYLDQLKTSDGENIIYKRISAIQVPNIPYLVDKYSVWTDNTEPVIMYLCAYYKKTSPKAPKGFWIVKTRKVFKTLKTIPDILTFIVVFILNLVIISISTLIFKQFNITYLLLISLVNTTWMYFMLLALLEHIYSSN